jgi:N-acetylneuraminic acid mutarotase
MKRRQVVFWMSLCGFWLAWVGARMALADGWLAPPVTGDIPSPRYGHSMVEIDGVYYIFGGQTVTTTAAGLRAPLGGPSDELFKFDPDTRQFTKLTPSGEVPGMSGHTSVAADGKMYILGGARSDGTNSNQYVYDPFTNAWTVEGAAPFGARQDVAAAVVNGNLYAAGGRSTDGAAVYDDLWRYDVAAKEWAQLTDLPAATYGANLTAYNGKLYHFGGRDAEGYDHNQLNELDPAYGYWEPKITNEGPDVRAYAVGAQAGSQLWIAGGSGGSTGLAAQAAGELRDIWVLDLDTFQWTRQADAAATRMQAAGALIPYPSAGGVQAQAADVSLFIFGGLSGGVPVSDTVQYYSGENPPPGVEYKIYLPLVVRQ